MKMPMPKEFWKWRESLSMIDRMNFDVLISLPTAKELVEKMEPGRYREMAAYALALSEVIKP